MGEISKKPRFIRFIRQVVILKLGAKRSSMEGQLKQMNKLQERIAKLLDYIQQHLKNKQKFTVSLCTKEQKYHPCEVRYEIALVFLGNTDPPLALSLLVFLGNTENKKTWFHIGNNTFSISYSMHTTYSLLWCC